MTAVEAYELISQGGATDFASVIQVCDQHGPNCLIGGLAVNCYVEPVYTMDADIVVAPESHRPPNAAILESQLRTQFTRDERYQPFLSRCVEAEILGVRAKIACLRDVVQGKLWVYGDPKRRLSKRKKDELDLIRLAEVYPELTSLYPPELRNQMDRP
ncbi:MAG: hypothetical protein ABSH50_00770 [Bryobacteraceae bacterium]|jgi:hypothetical protein